jgi:putative spermidine/putrescine transport system substrate-binding protein
MDARSRRHHLGHWSALGLALALPPAHAARARTLRVLAWPGYAEPEVVKSFEMAHRVRVEVTTIDSDAALWRRISARAGADFDVFAINTAELQRCIRQGLVLPVPMAAVPAVGRQLPRFQQVQHIQGLVHGGQTMAIPFTYAEMGLMYDRAHFAQPPTSITALWDGRHQGRVLAYNGGTHNFSLAAQALGLSSPFRLADADWPAAVHQLIALRRNVAAFYAQPEESLALFRQTQAVLMLANYGSQQLQLFHQAGLKLGYAIPTEGALAWLDCWAISRATPEPALAAAWINHLLGPQASALLVSRQGLSSTVQEPPYTQPSDKLVWLQPPEDDERRNRLWGRIASGDRFAKVMAA